MFMVSFLPSDNPLKLICISSIYSPGCCRIKIRLNSLTLANSQSEQFCGKQEIIRPQKPDKKSCRICRVFHDFEYPTSLIYHCKQLRFPDYRLFHSTHDSFNNSKTHGLRQRVPANPEIVIVLSGKGLK